MGWWRTYLWKMNRDTVCKWVMGKYIHKRRGSAFSAVVLFRSFSPLLLAGIAPSLIWVCAKLHYFTFKLFFCIPASLYLTSLLYLHLTIGQELHTRPPLYFADVGNVSTPSTPHPLSAIICRHNGHPLLSSCMNVEIGKPANVLTSWGKDDVAGSGTLGEWQVFAALLAFCAAPPPPTVLPLYSEIPRMHLDR